MRSNNAKLKRKERKSHFFPLLFLAFTGFAGPGWADPGKCPAAYTPPPPVRKIDLSGLSLLIQNLSDSQGRKILPLETSLEKPLQEIFQSRPQKTKLEQFFQLLYLLQKSINPKTLPLTVNPPQISNLLIAAQVFTDPSFPNKILSVELWKGHSNRSPLYRVRFLKPEVRFPINGGVGFASWDQGICQIARELVFYPDFSFRIRSARNSRNLVVDDFEGVEIFGEFGTRKVFSIDLNYVDLEKVEFIRGTDEGKVTARVAQREFRENEHSFLFKFIGTLIPNTSRQRIDW